MNDLSRGDRICDFKKRSGAELANCVRVVVTVDEVIAGRRRKFDETGDTKHVEYKSAFEREMPRKGRENPQIRRNYYLDDAVEEGNLFLASDSCPAEVGRI